MTMQDETGRRYKNAAEWWTAVEKLAEIRFGPKRGRWPHQDHAAGSGEGASGGTASSPVYASSSRSTRTGPSEPEASAASGLSRSPRRSLR